MKVLIAGAGGMIGRALTALLIRQGHTITRLVRAQSPDQRFVGQINSNISWDLQVAKLDASALEAFDAVVHLGGENIASQRWSETRKKALMESRLASTALLSKTLANLQNPPKVFACASAIGYYGDCGDQTVTELSQKGSGFLADLCCQWEEATTAASVAGIRVVNVRFGVVLSATGGALAKMLLPFELGAGGPIGDGKQFFSWIALDDAASAILHCLQTASLSGPVNITAPNPVTNKEFTRVLGKVLHRPTLLPVPIVGLRLLFGEMADQCLIAGQRVLPIKLQNSGYAFHETEIEPALRTILAKSH